MRPHFYYYKYFLGANMAIQPNPNQALLLKLQAAFNPPARPPAPAPAPKQVAAQPNQALLLKLQAAFKPSAPAPAPKLEPAPKAITNIRERLNGIDYHISGRNIIYDRTNLDGTIDRVERIWDVYGEAQLVFVPLRGGASNIFSMNGDAVRLPEARNYIMMCETRLKNYKPANVNVHKCGALLSVTRLPPPQPTLKEQIEKLQAQITQVNQELARLRQENNQLVVVNNNQAAEIARVQQLLVQLNGLLMALLRGDK
jgi:hypothetical protein